MKSTLSRLLGIALVVFASMTWVVDAEARRLGGGKTFGRQSDVTQRQATPPAAAPTQAARPAAAGGSRWMAPIAGLAAGLGLAALASWLGFGEELANFMLIALLVIAAVVVFRMLAARRQGGARPAFQGAGAGQAGQDNAFRYSPVNDGRGDLPGSVPAAAGGAAAMGAATQAGLPGVPAGFDVEGFVRTAKVQFVRLQAANDAGNLNDLREFTSPEMFAELKLDIDERGASANRTDVVTLDAELLGIETTATDHLASVRYTGMIREEEGAEAKPFDEVWVLAKPLSGGGWVLAGIRQQG
jgi:predicted lipid-binding transport protein (Tim44 family)